MGQVTFSGNRATPESIAYIKRAEQAIYAKGGNKDNFALAREVDMLYIENGLEPGTFNRAGTDGTLPPIQNMYDDTPRSYYSSGGGFVNEVKSLCLQFLGYVFGLAILFGGIWLMSVMGH